MTTVVYGLRVSSLAIAFALSTSLVLAQSGSTGGSIGNENKSLSGSRQDRSADPAPAAPKSKPAAEEQPRNSSRKVDRGGGGGGGGGGNFDGAWSVISVGCGGSSTMGFVISSGQISGEGLSGRVSPSGAASSVWSNGQITSNASGRFSGRSGSGGFRRTDGCSGTWSASKQ